MHTAHKALQDRKTLPFVRQKTSSPSYVFTKAKNTVTSYAIHFKEKMYIVQSVASLCIEEHCSTIKHNSGYSDGIVVSDTQAKVYIKQLEAYLWIHLVSLSTFVGMTMQ